MTNTFDQNGNLVPSPDKTVDQMDDREYGIYLKGYRDRDSMDDQQPDHTSEQEAPVEHATEQVIGKEIRPAPRPRRAPSPKHQRAPAARQPRRAPSPDIIRPERPLPAHMMSCTVPTLTRAGAMLNRPLPKGMTSTPKSMTGDFMRFDVPAMTAPKHPRQLDPFKGLAGHIGKAKALPEGMRIFGKGKGTKKKRGNFW